MTCDVLARCVRFSSSANNVVPANLKAALAPGELVSTRALNVDFGHRFSVSHLWSGICDLTGTAVDAEYGQQPVRRRGLAGHPDEIGTAQAMSTRWTFARVCAARWPPSQAHASHLVRAPGVG